MYSIFKNAQFALVLLICLGFLSCDSDSDPVDDREPMSFMDFVNVNGYDSLAVAIETAGLIDMLSQNSEYTLFAPSNNGFETFLLDNGFASFEEMPKEQLIHLLKNHLIEGTKRYSNFSTGYLETMANAGPDGENLSLYINTENGFLLNGRITLSSLNNEVKNGIVHGVSEVIDLPSVSTFLVVEPNKENDPRFDTFNSAMFFAYYSFNFTEKELPLTIFAPTNEAFEAFFQERGFTSFNDIDTETLRALLNYHIISGDNLSLDDFNDRMSITTILQEDLIINYNEFLSVTDVNDRTSYVTLMDLQTINGVIHAVDKVLLPSQETNF